MMIPQAAPPPLRFRMLNVAFAILCWVILLESERQEVTALLSKQRRRKERKKEIVIHKINSPMQWADIFQYIDNLQLHIDDPMFSNHFDAHFDKRWVFSYFYYIATWKDEQTVVGMVAVYPDLENKDLVGTNKLPILQGIRVSDVITAKPHRRKGVGTALMKAVESDAKELMELYSTEILSYRQDHSDVDASNRRELDGNDGAMEIRLTSVQEMEALSFYASLRYEIESWIDISSSDGTIQSILEYMANMGRSDFSRGFQPVLVKRLDSGHIINSAHPTAVDTEQ